MNLLTFVLMTVVILNYVTSTNVGFGSYLPGLSDPSYGLWTGGLGGGYGQLSGYGGPTFPSSNGYLPKRVKNHEPIVLEGGYENGNKFGNGGLILCLVVFLVLTRIIGKYGTSSTTGNDVIISYL